MDVDESRTDPLQRMPAAFQDAALDSLARLIADMLERLMLHNDRIPLLPESLTRFHSRSAPNITVLNYLKRIIKFTNVDKTCLMLTLHYIDQMCARMPLFTLSSLTCHRFIIAAITVSSKGLCDSFCTNALYAKVGGLTVTELNMLEREFLKQLDWRIMSTGETLQEYYTNLVRTHSTARFETPDPASSSSSTHSYSSDTSSHSSSIPSSPVMGSRRISATPEQVSTIMVDPASPGAATRPTMEQNMAFAALRQSQEAE